MATITTTLGLNISVIFVAGISDIKMNIQMAKQPYIPLYIGDWEQDTNCLSLAAEAAWLKIIFKMFKGDKSGVFKISTKALQNLWKCDTKTVQEICSELLENDVCFLVIEKDDNCVIFKNRRMVREAKISKVRSTAVQNRYKKDSKEVHPFENDTDNEFETVINALDRGEGKDLPIGLQMVFIFKKQFPDYPIDNGKDFKAALQIAQKLAKMKGWPKESVTNGHQQHVAEEWQALVIFAKSDSWYAKKSITFLNDKFQDFIQASKNTKQDGAKGTPPAFRSNRTGTANGIDPTEIDRTGPGKL